MYQIKNNILTVDIENHGAEIKAIKYQGLDLLHDANPEFWNRSSPYLFPNIGAMKDKYTYFNKKQYPLTKHGFLRDYSFSLVQLKEDSLELEFKASDKTKALYPFDFTINVLYQLKESKIETTFKVTNDGSDVMPFNFGLHPAFRIPFIEGTKFEDYKIVFSEEVNAKVPTVLLESGLIDWGQTINEFHDLKELPLDYEDYKYDAIIINPMPKGEIKIVAPNSSEIIVDAKDFKTLGIWTPYPKKAPFICIEPWIGYADGPKSNHEFTTKKDLIFLKPKENWQTKFSYTFNIKK